MSECNCYTRGTDFIKFDTYNNMLKMCCYHYYLHITELFCQPPLEIRYHESLSYKNIITYSHNGEIILLNKRDRFFKNTKSCCVFHLNIIFNNVTLNENEYKSIYKQSKEICNDSFDLLKQRVNKSFQNIDAMKNTIRELKEKLVKKDNLENDYNKLLQDFQINYKSMDYKDKKIKKQTDKIKQLEEILLREHKTIDTLNYKLINKTEELNKLFQDINSITNELRELKEKLVKKDNLNKRLVNLLTVYKYQEFNGVEKYDYVEIKQKNKALNTEFKRVAKLMKLC